MWRQSCKTSIPKSWLFSILKSNQSEFSNLSDKGKINQIILKTEKNKDWLVPYHWAPESHKVILDSTQSGFLVSNSTQFSWGKKEKEEKKVRLLLPPTHPFFEHGKDQQPTCPNFKACSINSQVNCAVNEWEVTLPTVHPWVEGNACPLDTTPMLKWFNITWN